jgi:hypothetical protein
MFIMERKDLTIGSKYGKLTVIDNIYMGGNGGSKVKVQCTCGNIYLASKYGVVSGDIKQCAKCYKTSPKLSKRTGIQELSGSHWGSIKRNADFRNIPFNITKEQIYDLFLFQNRKCALSGVNIFLDNYASKIKTASLDRINSKLDYSINNVQWVHKDINKIKQGLTNEEFINWCNLVFINNNVMSKRRQKPVVTTVSAEEQERLIKSVFELYKPNKVGLFFMKYFNRFTNVDQIASVLKMSKDKVIELEKKYYLNK